MLLKKCCILNQGIFHTSRQILTGCCKFLIVQMSFTTDLGYTCITAIRSQSTNRFMGSQVLASLHCMKLTVSSHDSDVKVNCTRKVQFVNYQSSHLVALECLTLAFVVQCSTDLSQTKTISKRN